MDIFDLERAKEIAEIIVKTLEEFPEEEWPEDEWFPIGSNWDLNVSEGGMAFLYPVVDGKTNTNISYPIRGEEDES